MQFYDWAYRPHPFGPEDGQSPYEDTMGKSIDHAVVKALLKGFRERNIRSLG